MSTTNENPGADRKSGSTGTQNERDRKANRDPDADTRNFIQTHDVIKVARKAVPGAGEEAADLLQGEQKGGSDTKGVKSSE